MCQLIIQGVPRGFTATAIIVQTKLIFRESETNEWLPGDKIHKDKRNTMQ